MDFNYAPEATDSLKRPPTTDTVEFSPGQRPDDPMNLMNFLAHEKTTASESDQRATNARETIYDSEDDDDDSANLKATTAGDEFKREPHSTSPAPQSPSDFNQPEPIGNGRLESDDDEAGKREPIKAEESAGTTKSTDSRDPATSVAHETAKDVDFLDMSDEEKQPARLDNSHLEGQSNVESHTVAEGVTSVLTEEAKKPSPAESTPNPGKPAEPLISIETAPSEKEIRPKHEATEKPSEIGPKDFFSKYGLGEWNTVC